MLRNAPPKKRENAIYGEEKDKNLTKKTLKEFKFEPKSLSHGCVPSCPLQALLFSDLKFYDPAAAA